jgi:hypothetical protein
MGFFDRLKGAVAVVTGGAAEVRIEYHPIIFPGDIIQVRITATVKSNPIKGDGIFVDIRGVEEIRVRKSESESLTEDLEISRETLATSFQVAGPFQLNAGVTHQWEGSFQMPSNAQPTFDGAICDHGWGIRGRLSMFGNDPDSGYQPIRVGLRN